MGGSERSNAEGVSQNCPFGVERRTSITVAGDELAMNDRRADYLKHAEECRSLARMAPADQQPGLIQMAKTWEKLARRSDAPGTSEQDSTE
jgi:hypothetical protein